MLRFIFRSIALVVFLGMNILYRLLWKKNAKADYFESMGISTLPPDDPDKLEFVTRPNTPQLCHCGYDLKALANERLLTDGEALLRCPKCEREVIVGELDLPPQGKVIAERPAEKLVPGRVEIAPDLMIEPEVAQPHAEKYDVASLKDFTAEKLEPPVEKIGAVI